MSKDVVEQTIRYYDEEAHNLIKSWATAMPDELNDFTDLLSKGSLVLDAGCAAGRDSVKFIEKGHRVVGIDLSSVLLKEARKRVPKAKFRKMDMRRLTFSKNYFDAIWANASLLHLQKKEVAKVLKGFLKIFEIYGEFCFKISSKEARLITSW